MFGSHLSIAGGMTNALDEARDLGLDCVQVFTKNQRQWNARPLDDEAVVAWQRGLTDLDWHRRSGPHRVVSHNSYLVNLASPDPENRSKSLALQRIELERCDTLGIPLCDMHPGAHPGDARPAKQPHDLHAPPSPDEQAGLERIVDALDQLHEDLPGYRVITCLETTVGSGSNLGYAFHQLAYIREHVREPERVGYCFDTCHVTAAGYDMTTPGKARAVLQECNAVCGMKNVLVYHFNDSRGDIGSRLDRHEHIGAGTCGTSCFQTILGWRGVMSRPKILETPKGTDEHNTPWDLVNLRRLRKLAPAT